MIESRVSWNCLKCTAMRSRSPASTSNSPPYCAPGRAQAWRLFDPHYGSYLMPETETKLNRYHFDLGNSSEGPVGFCGAVWAESEEAALEMFKNALPSEQEVNLCDDDLGTEEEPGVE